MPEYLAPPIETDPDALAQECFDFLQTQYPGWLPAEGNFEVWLTEALARMIAQLRDVTSLVPTSIFRYFGKTIMDIQPVDASPAYGTSTWTMIDANGYTIPAGTQFGIQDGSGAMQPFVVNFDVIVPPGSFQTAVSGVSFTAIFSGVGASGLTGLGQLIDVLPFVDTIIIEGLTSGGQDAQSDRDYLNHLVEQLRLMAPRPILPADFAAMTKNIAGVFRAAAVDGFVPAVNEVQKITVNATGGTFTVTFGANTTAALAYNITAAALQTALQGLASIGANNVLVTGGPGAAGGLLPYFITFVGAKGGANQAAITTNAASLTGAPATAAVVTVTDGAAAQHNVERYVTVFPIDEFGQPVSAGTKTAISVYMEGHREINFVIPVADPVYTGIDVQVTVVAEANADHNTVQNSVISALQAYLNPQTWGIPRTNAASADDWVNDTSVRFLEVAQVINNTPGVRYITSLLTAVHNGAPNTTDIVMPGEVALPTSGSIVVTVA